MKWQRILGVYFRYLYSMKRGLLHFTDMFYWPMVDIILWGLTSFWIQSQDFHGNNLPLIIMTGLIFWQICWRGSIDISVALLQEFWQRNLVNFFSTPLKFCEFVIGVLLLSVSKLVLTVAFGTLLVYLLYALNVFTVGWAFLPFAVSLIVFGWSISFLACSAIIYWGHSVEMFAWVVGGIFMPFSAVFYPVTVLPHWAQSISWCLPTTYIFEGMRMVLYQGIFPTRYFWTSIGLNALFLTASIFIFRCMFEKSRQKGLGRLE
jgi:ABC-2 type transport system permease protein